MNFRILRNLFFRITLGVVFICFGSSAFAQLTAVDQNKKDACEGLDNGSIEILVTNSSGPITIQIFGPPNFSASPADGVPELFTGLPPRSYFAIVQDDDESIVIPFTINDIVTPLNISVDATSNNTDCDNPNGFINITASGGSNTSYSYSWTSTNGFTSNAEDINGLNAAQYQVEVFDDGTNCSLLLVPVVVITDPSPDITVGVDDVTVCNPASGDAIITIPNSENDVEYELRTMSGVFFTPPVTVLGDGGSVDLVIPQAQVPVVNTTYEVVATNASCTPVVLLDTPTITITDGPTADAGSDEETCSNVSIDLSASTVAPTASNFSTLQWSTSGDGTFDDNSILTPVYTPGTADATAGTVTLTLQANGNGSCTPVTSDMILTVTEAPLADAGSDEEVCLGDDLDLSASTVVPTASNFSTLQWSTGGDGTFTDNSLLTPVYTPGASDITAGTVTLTLQANGNGSCTPTTDDITITINPLPTPTITGPTDVCLGDEEFYSTETGQSGYTWNVTGGTITVGGSGNTIAVEWTGTAPYEVSVNYSNPSGCFATTPTSQAINVINNTLSLTQSPDPGLCPGASIEITANLGFDTYEFRDGAGGPILQAASADNTFDDIGFSNGQVIEVIGFSALCGNVTETITLNVGGSPSLVLTQSPDPGCVGGSVEIGANAGFDTYEFRDGVGGTVLQAASSDFTFDATTFTDGQIIEVEAFSAACAVTLTEVITLNITTVPTLTLTQLPDPGCLGSTTEIEAVSGFDTYEFRDGVGGPILQAVSPDNTFDATTFTNGQIIEVEAFSSACGSFVETITLSISTVPALTLSQDPNPGLCPGASIEITATAGYDDYEFREGIGGPVLQAASADNTFDSNTFTDGQIIEVVATSTICGVFTETISLSIDSAPALALTQSPDPGLCPGSVVEITATSGFDTYEFRDGVGGPVLQAASPDNSFDATTLSDSQIIEVEAISAVCGTVIETITISIDGAPVLALSQNPDPGCDGDLVEITATTGFDTYEFRDGVGGPVLQAASADNTFDATSFTDSQVIEVEATSITCGTVIETISLNINTAPALALGQTPDPGCNGSMIEISATTGFDTYEFRDGVSGPILQAASADNTFDATTFTDGQTIEVEAFLAGCGLTTRTIDINVDPAITLTLSQSPNPGLCPGSSVEIAALAGFDTYEFRDGVGGPVLQGASVDNTFDATTLSDGQIIEVEATSTACGTSTETITVSIDATPTITITQSPNPACSGTNVVISASAGYDTYEFRDGVGGPVLQAASASENFVSNAFTNGQIIEVEAFNAVCGAVTATTSVNILPASDPSCGGPGGGGPICADVSSLSISNVTNPDCGLDNGSLTIDVTFSTPQASVIFGLKYFDEDLSDSVFNTQLNDPIFNDLAALNYRYFVTAGVDTCFLDFNLAPRTNVTADLVGTTDVFCSGEATGSIDINNLQGSSTGTYFYSVNGGDWTELDQLVIPNVDDEEGLVEGNNVVRLGGVVSDACPARFEVLIGSVNAPINYDIDITDLTDCDTNDGEIMVSASGGSGGSFTFAFVPSGNPISNGLFDSNSSQGSLPAGSYDVYIRDVTGCTVSETVEVESPGTITLSAINITDASCTNTNQGRVQFEINNRVDLGSNDYGIAIVENENSIATDTVYFEENWSGAITTFPPVTESGLGSGNYYIFVGSADNEGICEATEEFSISGGPFAVSFTSELVCDNNGQFFIRLNDVEGENFTGFEWTAINESGNSFTDSIRVSELNATNSYDLRDIAFFNIPGEFDIQLSQTQSVCPDPITSDLVDIDIPNSLEVEPVILSSSAPDLASGSFAIRVPDGAGVRPYVSAIDFEIDSKHPDYEVTGLESSGPDTLVFNSLEGRYEFIYENKPFGEYDYMVMDALGCSIMGEIDMPLDSTLFVPNVFTPNNDGLNDFFQIRNLQEGSELIVTNRWGNQVFSSDNYTNENAWDGGDLAEGVYFYKLESPDGGVYTGWVEILRGPNAGP